MIVNCQVCNNNVIVNSQSGLIYGDNRDTFCSFCRSLYLFKNGELIHFYCYGLKYDIFYNIKENLTHIRNNKTSKLIMTLNYVLPIIENSVDNTVEKLLKLAVFI